MKDETILRVKGLQTHFKTDDGIVQAVEDVSFELAEKETLGIVGESGSGKSVTNLSLMKLIPSPPGKIVGGEVLFEGEDLVHVPENQMRRIRGNKISMIFQDPMTCLNPFLRISTQMIEVFMLHQNMDKKRAHQESIEMLKLVGIPKPEKRVDDYPHQFSGGMRQRVMIAMALSCKPKILIADEPSTALDVTIQAQILELMKELSAKLNTAIIMITHDLGVVAGICDNVCVMYAGTIVEKAPTEELYKTPKHPYTQGLLNSIPKLGKRREDKLYSIEGQPPNLINLPDCCSFYPRCEFAMEICTKKMPEAIPVGEKREVKCWLYHEKKEVFRDSPVA
ncbi:MAG: ABC transporter ATP-binding protein [SAR324 cluster bacterium]|nr:ABC transporter ATP-binding protein [SAR324 cluster bacterium]